MVLLIYESGYTVQTVLENITEDDYDSVERGYFNMYRMIDNKFYQYLNDRWTEIDKTKF